MILSVPVSKLYANLMTHSGVHAVTELHQDEPVTKPQVLHDDGNIIATAWGGISAKDQKLNISKQNLSIKLDS